MNLLQSHWYRNNAHFAATRSGNYVIMKQIPIKE